MTRQLTAIIEHEDDGYVALCPKLDIASQGETATKARANLKEAWAQSQPHSHAEGLTGICDFNPCI